MSSSPPFVDPATHDLDTGQIWSEAVPVAALIVLFGALALVPLLLALLFGGGAGIGGALLVLAQFILAVGAAVVLMYVVARGIQLA